LNTPEPSNLKPDDKAQSKDLVKNNLDENKDNKETIIEKNRFDGKRLIHNDKGIPVLMYHCIDKEIVNGKENELKVTPEDFRAQMNYLKANGYTTLTLDEAYKFFQSNEGVPEKSVVLTFDDGYEDNYVNAFPVLKEMGFKATVFVVTDYVDKIGLYMTSSQLKELDANGFQVESHTANHERLNELAYEQQLSTLKTSKEFLEKLLNRPVNYFAYPEGKFNASAKKAVADAGYKMAFTTAGTWSDKSDGILTLDRVYISAQRDFANFKLRVTSRNY
jgi:peptidoglycan/xylan/chitin deacetylase (PgdA/CDA1 family)